MSDSPISSNPASTAKPEDTTPETPPLSAAATRECLIDAGLQLFAAQGYDAVSPRVLATVAGVNAAAIPFYFGGKEGVYLAVVQRIVQQLAPRMQTLIARLASQLDKASTPVAAAPLLEAFAAGQLEIMCQPASFAFLFREQFRHSMAFDLLYREILEPAHQFNARLIAALLQKEASDSQVVLLEHALSGQVSVFAQTQATLHRRLGHDLNTQDFDLPAIEQAVRHLVRYTVQGALAGRHGAGG